MVGLAVGGQVLPVREDAEGLDDDGRLVRLDVTGAGEDGFRLEAFAVDRAVELNVATVQVMVMVGVLGRAEGDIKGEQEGDAEPDPGGQLGDPGERGGPPPTAPGRRCRRSQAC